MDQKDVRDEAMGLGLRKDLVRKGGYGKTRLGNSKALLIKTRGTELTGMRIMLKGVDGVDPVDGRAGQALAKSS